MENSEQLWQNFRKSFIDNIKETPDEKILKLLDSSIGSLNNNRTNFYKNYLFDKIANDLDLSKEFEFLQVDISLFECSEYHGWPVRKIFVEVENNIYGCPTREIEKLCAVHAPLKILITWMWEEWNEKREEYLEDDWNYVINSCLDIHGNLPGTLAVIVGVTDFNEDRKGIKYYSCKWNNEIRNFEPDEVLYDRIIS